MTTVKQFREYLATLSDDLIVRVLTEKSANWSAWTEFVPLELPAAGINYSDQLDVCGTVFDIGQR